MTSDQQSQSQKTKKAQNQINELTCANSSQFNPVEKNKQASKSKVGDCCLSLFVPVFGYSD